MKELSEIDVQTISGGFNPAPLIIPAASMVMGMLQGAAASESMCLQKNIFDQLSCVAGKMFEGSYEGAKFGIIAAWAKSTVY